MQAVFSPPLQPSHFAGSTKLGISLNLLFELFV
jgi:hypothetical protein